MCGNTCASCDVAVRDGSKGIISFEEAVIDEPSVVSSSSCISFGNTLGGSKGHGRTSSVMHGND
eukprot:9751125-Ditylum_brightwellii.AAC.1